VANYNGFNALNGQFGEELAILTFPCPQFLNQEPGDNDEILNGLKYVRPGGGYVPQTTMFQLITVNGMGTDPLYTWLKNSCPPVSAIVSGLSYNPWTPLMTTDIQWNFEKFLIDKNGVPVSRWTTETDPADMATAIKALVV